MCRYGIFLHQGKTDCVRTIVNNVFRITKSNQVKKSSQKIKSNKKSENLIDLRWPVWTKYVNCRYKTHVN